MTRRSTVGARTVDSEDGLPQDVTPIPALAPRTFFVNEVLYWFLTHPVATMAYPVRSKDNGSRVAGYTLGGKRLILLPGIYQTEETRGNRLQETELLWARRFIAAPNGGPLLVFLR